VISYRFKAALVTACMWATGVALAAGPEDFLKQYAEQAKIADPSFAGFSAQRGRAFYEKQHPVEDNGMLSCASCHHPDPLKTTQAHRDQIPCRACHVVFARMPDSYRPTRREIPPFAPAGNPNRFTNEWKVEYWFDYNCKVLLKRACTPQEKGDLITWLMTAKKQQD